MSPEIFDVERDLRPTPALREFLRLFTYAHEVVHGSRLRDLYCEHGQGAVCDRADEELAALVRLGVLARGAYEPTTSQRAFRSLQTASQKCADVTGTREHFCYVPGPRLIETMRATR